MNAAVIIEEKVMGFANRHGWSDIHPCEIIKRNTDKKITIRAMKHSKIKNGDQIKFHVGGFAANCSNQEIQEYDYFQDENSQPFPIRFSKAKNGWFDKYGDRYVLAEKPRYFYDYNF